MSALRLLSWALALVAAGALAFVGFATLGSARRLDAQSAALAAGAAPAQVQARTIPGRLGDWVLGSSDDRGYRDALGLARAAASADAPEQAQRLRAEAERLLSRLQRSSSDDRLRSRAANLLGELLFAEAKEDPRNPRRFTEQAYGAFQDAVLLDPGNDVARRNLELLARLPADLSFTEQPPPGDQPSASPESGGGF